MSEKNNVFVAVLVILIVYSWLACAYIIGANADRMILHPIVPILFIPLLFSFRKIDSTKLIATIAIILISIWLFVRLQSVFMPFIIGFSLAYVVNVSLSGLQNIPLPKDKRLHLPKWAAALVLIILLIGILSLFAFLIIPQLIEQAGAMKEGIIRFYNTAIEYIMKTAENLENGEYPFKDRLPESWQNTISEYIDNLAVNIQEKIPSVAESASQIISGLLSRLSSGLLGTLGRISSAFFILIVFVYTIQSFRSNIERMMNIFPESQRRTLTRYATEIDKNMRAFLKGQLTIIIIISTISAIAYSIIRVPFALLVGLMAGLCNAIPTIGPVLGGAIAVLASATGFAAGSYALTRFLLQIILVIGVAIGIQLLDSSIISPRIMSSAVEVHPLVVMFAVLLSASLIGIWGAVLAIPGIVIIKGIIKVSASAN